MALLTSGSLLRGQKVCLPPVQSRLTSKQDRHRTLGSAPVHRHTDRQTDRQTHMQKDRHTHTQTDTDTHKHIQTDRHTHRRTDRQTHTERDTHAHTCTHTAVRQEQVSLATMMHTCTLHIAQPPVSLRLQSSSSSGPACT